MGLFDRRSKRKKESENDLNEYIGTRFEVMDGSDRLLFVGRANSFLLGELELQPITVPRLAPNAGGIPVRMRCYRDAEKKAVHMEGLLSLHSNGLCTIRDIEITGKDNDRAFFRQDTAIGGEVMPIKQTGVYSEDCRLINISAGGVCIWVDAEYMLGDRLLLKSNLLEGWELTPLVCVVRRITKRKQGYEYGCEFAELTPATEDLISKAILEMQLRLMRRE